MKKLISIFVLVSLIAFSFNQTYAQWVQMASGINGGFSRCYAVSGSNIYMGSDCGVYKSINNTSTWTQTSLNSQKIYSIASNSNFVVAGTYLKGVYYSTDNGITWTQSDLNNVTVYSLAFSGSFVYAGTQATGVYKSTNNGVNWVSLPNFNNQNAHALTISGINIFVGTPSNGVYKSTDAGFTWAQTTLNNKSIYSLASSGSNIFAGDAGTTGVYVSTDNGTTWNNPATLNNKSIQSLAIDGVGNIYAGTSSFGVFISINNGLTWTQSTFINQTVYGLGANGNNIFAGTYVNGTYLSINNGSSWTQSNNGFTNVDIVALDVSGANIFAATALNGVYLSANNGITWSQTSSALNFTPLNCLVAYGINLWAGTNGYGVYLSGNNGATWTQCTDPNINTKIVYHIEINISNGSIYAGTGSSNSGVYKSTNNGLNWTQTSLNNQTVRAIVSSGNNVIAGTGQGVQYSTDNGTTWTQSSLGAGYDVYSLAFNGSNVFAGTNGNHIYKSLNYGVTWSRIDTGNAFNGLCVYALTSSGTNLIAGLSAGAYAGGVFISKDSGYTWVPKYQGLGFQQTNAVGVSGLYAYAGVIGNSVYRRLLTDLLLGVHNVSNTVPNSFILHQNYPNPFNPTTSIRYVLPVKGIVKLAVYDALGRGIETLVNEIQNSGVYEAAFDASHYSSGVYFYRLTTDNFSDTKRMILVK